ncbi:hypothetical protein EDB83DRAFT_2538708 [Lactarius deliciosus]|nr:hypothetical protein EDB83DRAFT_2538708 [Lactarius deliciosus]
MDVDVGGRGGGGGVGLVVVVIAAAAITPWSSSLPPPSLLGVVLTIVVVILAVTVVVILTVTAQPGRGPEDDDYDPQRENEVRAATAVLERLLGAWEYETDHVQTARAVSSYTPHPSTRYQEPWE